MSYPVIDNNILMGPVNIYIGAQGAQWPADLAITPDGMAVPPPAPTWLPVGGTNGGAKVSGKPEFTDLEVDQIMLAPGTRMTGLMVNVSTTLAESTQQNLNLAMNNLGVYAVQQGYSTLDFYIPAPASPPQYISLILDGQAPASQLGAPMRRRWVIPKVLNKAGWGDLTQDKKTQQGIAVDWTVFWVSQNIQFIHIVDELV